MSEHYDEQHPVIQQVLRRAATDATFRARLTSEPHAAIQDETGVAVPADYDVRFVERLDGGGLEVSFPPAAAEEDELSLDDLDAAAGGTGGGYDAPW